MLFLFLLSCASLPPTLQTENDRIIEAVPFFPQEEYQCGPASLAGVLNYYGLRVTPADIAAEIFSRQAGGTLDMDMVFYAERKGLKAEQYAGSFEDLRENIDARRPLIILIDQGLWVYQNNHFMVVVGYGQGGIIANSGREKNKFIPSEKLLKSWGRTKFWTLRITL